jgi:uncharacterized protein YndB with AHSA1/START domain
MSNSAAGSKTAEDVRSLVIERMFPHPPEKLWRALTESPLLAQWLMSNDFEPRVGRRFQFRSQPVPGWDGLIDCEVLVVEPMKQLSYSWSSMGADFVVLWTLSPVGSGTEVRMEQSGFTADQQQAYGGAKYGWKMFLDNLERVLGGTE